MTRSRHFAERRPSRSAHELRPVWVDAVALGEMICAHVREASVGGAPDAAGQTLTRLAVGLRDLQPENFPVQSIAGRTCAAVFVSVGRVLVDIRTGTETRTACAAVFGAAVESLAGFLAELRTTEARGWRGQFEKDD